MGAAAPLVNRPHEVPLWCTGADDALSKLTASSPPHDSAIGVDSITRDAVFFLRYAQTASIARAGRTHPGGARAATFAIAQNGMIRLRRPPDDPSLRARDSELLRSGSPGRAVRSGDAVACGWPVGSSPDDSSTGCQQRDHGSRYEERQGARSRAAPALAPSAVRLYELTAEMSPTRDDRRLTPEIKRLSPSSER